jgi:hypothetical protein
MCAKLRAEGKGTNRHLIRALMTSTLDEIYDRLKGTIADPLTNPKAERMANSVRGVFNAHAKALMFLPDEGESLLDQGLGGAPARSPRSCS